MDYSKLSDSIVRKVMAAMALINNPEVSPEVRQLNQEILLKEVGQSAYNKAYEMNAFDMEIPHTKGVGIDDRYYGMAKKASSSVSTGKLGLEEYTRNYLNNTIGKAQHDAMRTAKQSGKRPTVERVEHGDACKWCQSMAGTYEDPPDDIFRRHGGCEAKIITKGYKSRNGELSNYKKSAKSVGASAPIAKDGGQVVYRGVGANAGNFGNILGNALYVSRDQAAAAKFGSVTKLSLPLKSKDIFQITSDSQLDKLILDGQKWAIRNKKSLETDIFIPEYLKSRGYKAAEIAASVDPLGGIAIFDSSTVKKIQKQIK